MKYETPRLTASTAAINAIQDTDGATKCDSKVDHITDAQNDGACGAYEDWE